MSESTKRHPIAMKKVVYEIPGMASAVVRQDMPYATSDTGTVTMDLYYPAATAPGVRLPAAVVEALSLKEGDEIEIQVAGARAFEVKKRAGTRELLARLRRFRGRLPADFKFDRLEANQRSMPR